MADRIRPPQELAERVLAHARAHDRNGRSPSSRVDVACAAFHRTGRELSRWVGSGGCHALLARAVTKAKVDHTALGPVTLLDGPELRLEGVVGAGDPEGVAEGLESALETLFELLSRLVGADLAWQLVESSLSNDLTDLESGNRDPPL